MGSVIHSLSCVTAQKPHWVGIYGLFLQDCEHLLQVCDSPPAPASLSPELRGAEHHQHQNQHLLLSCAETG